MPYWQHQRQGQQFCLNGLRFGKNNNHAHYGDESNSDHLQFIYGVSLDRNIGAQTGVIGASLMISFLIGADQIRPVSTNTISTMTMSSIPPLGP